MRHPGPDPSGGRSRPDAFMAFDPRRLTCPRCQADWPEGEAHRCAACGFTLHADWFPAAFRPRTVPAPTGAAESPGSTTDPVCYLHPQRRASVPCDQCGRLVCGLCEVQAGPRHLCPPCFDAAQTRADGELPSSRTLYGRIALGLSVIPLFPPTALAALVVLAVGRGKPGSLVRPSRFPARVALVLALLQLTAFSVLVALAASGAFD